MNLPSDVAFLTEGRAVLTRVLFSKSTFEILPSDTAYTSFPTAISDVTFSEIGNSVVSSDV